MFAKTRRLVLLIGSMKLTSVTCTLLLLGSINGCDSASDPERSADDTTAEDDEDAAVDPDAGSSEGGSPSPVHEVEDASTVASNDGGGATVTDDLEQPDAAAGADPDAGVFTETGSLADASADAGTSEGGAAFDAGGNDSDASAGDASGGDAGAPLDPACPTFDLVEDPQTCDDAFSITVTCVAGPCARTTYVHEVVVTWNGLGFTGTGTVIGDTLTPVASEICGGVVGGTMSFHLVYTTYVPGYTVDGSAEIGEDGAASGTGSGFDPRGATQAFTVEVSPMNVGCAG
jgi:hypothetical protein